MPEKITPQSPKIDDLKSPDNPTVDTDQLKETLGTKTPITLKRATTAQRITTAKHLQETEHKAPQRSERPYSFTPTSDITSWKSYSKKFFGRRKYVAELDKAVEKYITTPKANLLDEQNAANALQTAIRQFQQDHPNIRKKSVARLLAATNKQIGFLKLHAQINAPDSNPCFQLLALSRTAGHISQYPLSTLSPSEKTLLHAGQKALTQIQVQIQEQIPTMKALDLRRITAPETLKFLLGATDPNEAPDAIPPDATLYAILNAVSRLNNIDQQIPILIDFVQNLRAIRHDFSAAESAKINPIIDEVFIQINTLKSGQGTLLEGMLGGKRTDKRDSNERHTMITCKSGSTFELLNSMTQNEVTELGLDIDQWTINTKPPTNTSDEQFVVQLGRGTSGRVRLAYDRTRNTVVAVKKIKMITGLEEVLDEIQLSRKADNNTGIIDATIAASSHGEEIPYLYIFMPILNGINGRKWIETERDLDQREQVARSMVDAIKQLHERGIYHRDIKPENFIVVDGTACLIDFGAATDREHSTVQKGSPAFFAPEIATLSPPNGATPDTGKTGANLGPADVYSLGISLVQVLSGNPTWTPTDTSSLNLDEFPEPFNDLIEKMLSNSQEDRPVLSQVRRLNPSVQTTAPAAPSNPHRPS